MPLPSRFKDDNVVEVGVDEAGRGCLWGPVCCAAVVWPFDEDLPEEARNSPLLEDINDSKKLSAKKRDKLKDFIERYAVAHATVLIDAQRIDEINILRASIEGMHKALDAIRASHPMIEFRRILVDGTQFKTYHDMEHYTIVKGDGCYLSIAAASILAKVTRDTWVSMATKSDPTLDAKYGMASNMGYGAKKHMDGLKAHGTTEHHRMSYAPCKAASKLADA